MSFSNDYSWHTPSDFVQFLPIYNICIYDTVIATVKKTLMVTRMLRHSQYRSIDHVEIVGPCRGRSLSVTKSSIPYKIAVIIYPNRAILLEIIIESTEI